MKCKAIRFRHLVVLCALVSILLCSPIQAEASLVAFDFSGIIDICEGSVLNGYAVGLGTRYTGTLSYDYGNPTVLYTPDYKQHYLPSSFSFMLAIGNITVVSDDLGLNEIVIDPVSSSMTVTANGGTPDPSIVYGSGTGIDWRIKDNSKTTFLDAALPTSLQLTDYSGEFFLNGSSVGSYDMNVFVHGSIEEFSQVPVPEPSTVLLLCFGLSGIAGFRKKLKCRR